VIENVLIQDNTFSETTFPVELVSISSNNRFSNAQILRNRFVGRNVSPITLCAIWNEGSPPASGNIIEDTLISENIFQENNNPAIHLNGGLNAKAMGNTIINTQIVNNLIVGNKDGIFLSGSFEGANGNRIEKTVISNNIFRDNEGPSVSISGGENLGTTGNAILDTQILNNLMTGTRRFVVIGVVGGRNGASGNRIDTVRIINNTIAENPIIDVGAAAIGVVPDIEGSVGNSIGGVTVLNTIFWDNLWGDFSGVTSDEVAFCITSQLGFVGINGNISTDPKFVNPAEGDFHLQPGSPAIDAGTSQGTPVSDLEGNARFDDPATVNTGGGEVPYYDIGCFEYHRPDVASLTIIEEGTGSGMVTSSPAGISCGPTCSGSYIQGTSVTLTAAPSSGSVFAGWSGVCSGTGDCVVTMDSDKSVTATFNLQVAQYSLTVVKVGTGDGTVTSSPAGISCGSACSEIFQKATRVKLTATANSDSIFTGWSGGGCSGTKPCQVTVDSAITITASFDKKVPHISVSPNPLPFGSVKVGKNLKKTLQIANNGTGDLSVSIGGLGGPDFSVAGSTNIMVKPKKSYKLNITFKPTSTGDKTATLVLNSNDPAATTISISLTGKGI